CVPLSCIASAPSEMYTLSLHVALPICSTFGLTNDGIDPGVGFYVDGVYYARPAAAALDFIDIEQIEVLRGPQGTLFGKNTTAGAFNITTRKPSFTPEVNFEASYG